MVARHRGDVAGVFRFRVYFCFLERLNDHGGELKTIVECGGEIVGALGGASLCFVHLCMRDWLQWSGGGGYKRLQVGDESGRERSVVSHCRDAAFDTPLVVLATTRGQITPR